LVNASAAPSIKIAVVPKNSPEITRASCMANETIKVGIEASTPTIAAATLTGAGKFSEISKKNRTVQWQIISLHKLHLHVKNISDLKYS
jgi:hypothetical protein